MNKFGVEEEGITLRLEYLISFDTYNLTWCQTNYRAFVVIVFSAAVCQFAVLLVFQKYRIKAHGMLHVLHRLGFVLIDNAHQWMLSTHTQHAIEILYGLEVNHVACYYFHC